MCSALFVHDHPFYKIGENFFSPGRFPASSWDRYLNSGLVEKIYVVSRGIKSPAHSFGLVKSSKPCVEFDPLYIVKGGLDYYRYAKEIRSKLECYIKKVDVVVIRVPSFFGGHAYDLCKKLNKPYVVEVVGCAWDSNWYYGSLAGKLLAPVSYLSTRRIVSNSSAAIYVTKLFLQSRYPTNAEITSFASNVQIPQPTADTLERHIESLRNCSGRVLRVGSLGNVAVKYKGYDVAIKALSEVKRLNPELKFEFLIAGGGSSSYLEGLLDKYKLRGQVKLVGQLAAGADVFDFLDGLDLYLQPSLTEGLPRAVIEAMSRACPVLASKAGGIPELLDEGVLHTPGDSGELCEDLVSMLTDVDKRIEMAKVNFAKSKDYVQLNLEHKRRAFFIEAFKRLG